MIRKANSGLFAAVRTHRLALRPEALAEASAWIENQRERWELLFDVVGEYLEERKERR